MKIQLSTLANAQYPPFLNATKTNVFLGAINYFLSPPAMESSPAQMITVPALIFVTAAF